MQTIADPTLHEIIDYFNLGKKILDIKSVPGGLLHKLWYLKTDKKCYAVKQLNLSYINDLAHNLASPERSQRIALQMQTHHIPTIVACLSRQDNYSFTVNNNCYMVFPWLEGIACSNQETSLSMAKEIGVMLAHIHNANLEDIDLHKPEWSGYSKNHWQTLLETCADESKKLLKEIDISQLVIWSELAEYSLEKLNKELLISHRDLDAKNLLWQKNKAILLDWEYAGLINPQLDLLIVCLNFSEVIMGRINWQKFAAISLGYETIMPRIKINEQLIFGYYGYCLDWLEFNLRRLVKTNCNEAITEILASYTAMQVVTRDFAP